MNSEQAFEALFASVATALNESLRRHSQAALQGDLKALDAESDLQRKLVAARNQLQAVRDMWPLLVGEQPEAVQPETGQPEKGSARVRERKPGRQTKEGAYYAPILRALEEMGGRGVVGDVLDRVGQIMADDLTEHDRGMLKSGSIRWTKTAQWARYRMKERGLLADDSPAGIWEITEQGRRYLRERGK